MENLKSFKDLFGNDQSNVLITSAFHMKRSIMIANKFNLKLIPYAVDFRSNLNKFVEKKKEFSILNYIQTFNVLNNLNSFNIFFRELLGILAFKIFFNLFFLVILERPDKQSEVENEKLEKK